MITGGSEATVTPMAIGGFANMKALSERNDSPETASRPFDATRDGFVMGEGGGIVILERHCSSGHCQGSSSSPRDAFMADLSLALLALARVQLPLDPLGSLRIEGIRMTRASARCAWFPGSRGDAVARNRQMKSSRPFLKPTCVRHGRFDDDHFRRARLSGQQHDVLGANARARPADRRRGRFHSA